MHKYEIRQIFKTPEEAKQFEDNGEILPSLPSSCIVCFHSVEFVCTLLELI